MQRLVPRFWYASDGVTAIEFAVLGPLLLYFIFASFEVGIIYTQRELLDRAVANATKKIYTDAEITQDSIKNYICADLILAGPNCRDNLELELLVVTPWDPPENGIVCRVNNTNPNPLNEYNAGGASEYMFMRVCYMKRLLLPGVGFALSLPSNASGRVALISSSAFVNEPF